MHPKDHRMVVIRIYHECEDGIEKFHPKDHSLASRGLLYLDLYVLGDDALIG